ncbi:MAG: hypothetical protein J6T92_00965 [Ottowia sp.]|nr:hypothetical protein [Ottowia sp.]
MDVADRGKPNEHASAVGIAQTALDAIFCIERGIYVVRVLCVFRPRLKPLRVYHVPFPFLCATFCANALQKNAAYFTTKTRDIKSFLWFF